MNSDRHFAGKTGLVAEAGSGIGRATALQLAASGAYVVAAHVNEPAAQETAATMGPNGRRAPEFQAPLRLQCLRNAVTSLLPGRAVRHVAIRRKCIVLKVGLEPTPSCEDRILSPGLLPYTWYWKHV